MGFSASNNRASIEASYGQEQPNPFSLRTLIDSVYQPMATSDFERFLGEARRSGRHLSLAGADGDFISFGTWFDQLTQSVLDKDFISRLTKFSTQKMHESMKDLVSFFKLDRFCELRALYGFLKTNPSSKAYLSKPNSSHNKHKTDLITLLPKGKEIAFQVKAADAKKARTAGLNLIQKVSSSSLDYLKQQFEAVLALAS